MAKDDKKPDLENVEEEITEQTEEVTPPTEDAEMAEEIVEEATEEATEETAEETTEEVETSDETIDELIKNIAEETSPANNKPEAEAKDSDNSPVEDEGAEISTSVESERVTVVEDSDNGLVGDEGAEISTSVDSERVTVVEGPPAKSNEVSDAGEENDRQDPLATKPKKKSKAPLIILLCLLLCAIGGLVAWLIIRSTPEAQVSDAISNFLTSKQFSMTGSISLKFNETTNPDIRSVKLDLGASSAHIPASTSATLSITTQDNSSFKLDLGQAISSEGIIYLKLSGLQKAIDNAKVPDGVQAYLDYFSDAIEEADGQWWMVSPTDILDQQGFDTSYGDAYQCVLNQITKNDGSELANLYRKYPFINVENYTGTALQPVDNGTIFSVSINRPKLTSFQDELANTSYQKSLKTCLDQLPTTSDSNSESTSSQINNLLDNIAKLPPAYIEVAGFDHHLARFYYDYSSDDLGSLILDLRFSFPANISVDMPSNARDITELVDLIVDDMQYLMYDINNSRYTITDCFASSTDANCKTYVYTN